MKYLKDWMVDGWEKTEAKTDRGEVDIYYKPSSDKNGFEFKVLEFAEQTMGEDIKFDHLIGGVAYYDGLRHMWFVDEEGDMNGYLHYTDPNLMVMIFQVLAELEKMYCSEGQL